MKRAIYMFFALLLFMPTANAQSIKWGDNSASSTKSATQKTREHTQIDIEMERINKKKRVEYTFNDEQFLLFNYAGTEVPQHSFGFTYGWVKRWGWYFNMMVGTGTHYKTQYDAGYYGSINGSAPFYTGKTSENRLSFTVGGVARFIPWLGAYAGIGYGYRTLSWEMVGGDWVRISSEASPNNGHGAHLETGLIGGYKGVTLSLGFSSIVGKGGGFVEGKAGIGYMFNNNWKKEK